MSTKSRTRRRKLPAKDTIDVVETQSEVYVVPYDENLLERSRTQWQFGDWVSLTKLDSNTLQQHPDRAKLALLAAAGHLQTDNPNVAMQYLRLAKDWGCGNKLIVQILAAGVHNSLGRAAAHTGQQHRAFSHFERAILLGAPGSDTRLFAQARTEHQFKLLNLHTSEQGNAQLLEEASAKTVQPVDYLINISIRINNASPVQLGLSASNSNLLKIQQKTVEYQTEKSAPLYLVSNENGDFQKPPCNSQLSITADTTYIFSGEIAYTGDNRPIIWIFQYAEGKKIDAQSIILETTGRFRHTFKGMPNVDSFAIGIRLAGKGRLILKDTVFSLQELGDETLAVYFEEKLEKFKQTQKRDVDKSMKQIEDCIRLQHYLGDDIILPDLHNWPISPDFGVLLVGLVEQNNYDAVIEFGSGSSTLLLAKALDRVGRREQCAPASLLSFDHLPEYEEKTKKLLKQAGLMKYTNVVLAPLTAWHDESGEQFSYYTCDEALRALEQRLPDSASHLLVVVDGPPAITGRHARYPALQKILSAFNKKYIYHFLMDDYLRTDEQEIVARWLNRLGDLDIPCHCIEYDNLEKKACLVEVNSVNAGRTK